VALRLAQTASRLKIGLFTGDYQTCIHQTIGCFRRLRQEAAVNKLEYSVMVEPLSAEDGGGFVATVPDLPGCMSDGETPEEALANVRDAIAAWIEAAHDMGHMIPQPSRRLALTG
jgi:predicted RNase H-like HicB family nuclease